MIKPEQIQKGIKIYQKHDEWLSKHHYSFSKYVRNKIDEDIQKEELLNESSAN